MTTLLATPDVQMVLADWVEANLAGHTCRPKTPADFTGLLPFHRLVNVTGNRPAPGFGQLVIVTDTFDADFGLANRAALDLMDLIEMRLPGYHDAPRGAAFGGTECTAYPSWQPWENTNVERIVSTFVVHMHSVIPTMTMTPATAPRGAGDARERRKR